MRKIVEHKTMKVVGIDEVNTLYIGVDQTGNGDKNRRGFIAKSHDYKWSVIFLGCDYDHNHTSESYTACLKSVMANNNPMYAFETKNELLKWLMDNE